jgi:hypothetical protein
MADIDLRFPAMVRGLPPRCKDVRSAICLLPMSLEVPGADEAALPVVLTLKAYGHDVVYRGGNQRFYRKVAFDREGSDRDHLRFARACGLEMHMLRSISSSWDGNHSQRRSQAVWPTKADHLFDRQRGLITGHAPVLDAAGLFEDFMQGSTTGVEAIVDPERKDVDHWTGVAERYLEGAVQIEGDVWIEVPEPVFVAGGPFPAGALSDHSWYDGRSHDWRRPRPFGLLKEDTRRGAHGLSRFWDLDVETYSIDRVREFMDKTEAAGREGLDERVVADSPSDIVVLDPEVFGKRRIGLDVDRLVRIAAVEIEKERESGFSNHLSLELRTAQRDAATALDHPPHSFEEPIPCAAEHPISELVRQLRKHVTDRRPDWHAGRDYRRIEELLSTAHDEWSQRSITLAF